MWNKSEAEAQSILKISNKTIISKKIILSFMNEETETSDLSQSNISAVVCGKVFTC